MPKLLLLKFPELPELPELQKEFLKEVPGKSDRIPSA